MSYQYQRWCNGDDVTSAKLNRIENGIASCDSRNMLITGTMNSGVFTLNTTFSDIQDAFLQGKNIIIDMTPYIGQMWLDKVSVVTYDGMMAGFELFSVNSSGYPYLGSEK